MAEHFYPVIFEPENIGYSVYVPDIEGCNTQGETLEECLHMVQEAIGLMLEGIDEKNYPVPSVPQDIDLIGTQFIMVVPFNKIAYDKKYNTKAVKKTLSLPKWLNDIAVERHINFSGVLQKALIHELNIDKA